MPPKVAEKKLVAKKAAAFVQKEIDPIKYIRKVVSIDMFSIFVDALSSPSLTVKHCSIFILSMRYWSQSMQQQRHS